MKKLLSVILVFALMLATVPFGAFTFTVSAITETGYVWPVEGQIFGRGFSSEHEAIDIVAPTGVIVKSVNNGTVICASTATAAASGYCSNCGHGGAGYHVAVQYSNGIKAMYAHLSNVCVTNGQSVVAGQQIGNVGSTGNSTGPHLHFAMFLNGFSDAYAVDPLDYLTPFSNVYATDITRTSATIHGTFGAYGPTMTAAGIYIGTNSNNLTKITETLNTNGYDSNGNPIDGVFYGTGKWYGTLKENTTYYYRVWISRYGKEYVSDLKTFTTLGSQNPSQPLSVSSRVNCNFKVTIPANYRVSLYFGETDTVPAPDNFYAPKENSWILNCVQKLIMSDGSIRYKFNTVSNETFYFIYDTSRMSVTQSHKYDNACDKTCNLCGATRTVSGHVYTNSCDKTCNVCGATRTITHSYSNNCDDTCNVCGATRTPSDHVYDNSSDNTCNECGATRNTNWQIRVNETGVYDIQYTVITNGFNGISTIGVFDSKNNEVLYNHAKKGWPLIAGQNYTIEFYGRYDSIVSVDWDIAKISDTLFPDTSASGWYNDAVTYAVGAGIMSGYSNGKFGTSDSIQRQDFLVMLARLDGVNLTTYGAKESAFNDVPEGSYFEAAVNWGVEKGIVTGYQNGKFGVGDKVTREQLVTFLYRYAKYKGYDYSYTNNRETVVSSQYKDFKNVSGFAKQPILWAIEKGVISGKTSTTIVPHGNAQRCEVAQIMYNIYLKNIFR